MKTKQPQMKKETKQHLKKLEKKLNKTTGER
jgi:hypothetical protein